MPKTRQDIFPVLLHSAILDWLTTLSLIFGGCCSNAWALEIVTSQNPYAGTLITFAQFLLVSLYGLWKHLTVIPPATSRKELIRLVCSDILALHANKRKIRPTYVAIEVPRRVSSLLAEELVHEIQRLSPGQAVRHFTRSRGKKDVPWVVPEEESSVVIVDGHQLYASDKLRKQWDYSILLVTSSKMLQDSTASPRPENPSMTVDVTTPSCPVIISPLPTVSTALDLLKAVPRIRLKKRSIPLFRWIVQVVLFLLTSLLNNAAFGYDVPMTVHIIFRSGGPVVNMILGRLTSRTKYTRTQVVSVLTVTLGVICTTLSASQPSERVHIVTSSSTGTYFLGIMLLTLALVMSGFMGLTQDRTYARYGRGHWQEALFYLHFLAMPGFFFLKDDLVSQVRTVNASARVDVGLDTLAMPFVDTAASRMPMLLRWRISIPSFYLPLLLNTATQLVCVSGVHRLTSRVNSLTVTLVLVVRKAVSLGISVVLLKTGRGGGALLWTGAALVLAGTMGYAGGGEQARRKKKGEGSGGRDTKKER